MRQRSKSSEFKGRSKAAILVAVLSIIAAALFGAPPFETCLALAVYSFGGGAGFSVGRFPQHRGLIDVDGRFWVV
jgi:hypothetical protein